MKPEQVCGSVTDASVVHAPCDHIFHAACLGRSSPESGTTPEYSTVDYKYLSKFMQSLLAPCIKPSIRHTICSGWAELKISEAREAAADKTQSLGLGCLEDPGHLLGSGVLLRASWALSDLI